MFGRKARRTKRPTQRRFLSGLERLENRNLLSGSPWQNPMSCNDLDDDGTISASDALVAINSINASGSGDLAGKMTAPTLAGGGRKFVDANGDGALSAADPLSVINALNSGNTNAASQDDTATTADQPDTISADAPALTLTNGFARVRAGLNTATDVDVFRVTATTTSLNVALFTRGGGMTVTLVDEAGTTVDSATTAEGDHAPAVINATVTAGGTYFITVSSSTGVTGGYCLQVVDGDATLPPPPHQGGHDDADDDDTSSDDPVNHDQPLPPADLFTKLDADASGGLSVAEFSTLPPPKGATQTPEAVFTKFDADANGSLSLDEFLAIATHKPGADENEHDQPEPGEEVPPPGNTGGPPHGGPGQDGPGQSGPGQNGNSGNNPGGPKGGGPPEPADVFEHLDANEDGSLSATEFATFRAPPGVTTAVDALFAVWDTDTSSLLSLTEFEAGLAGLKKA